MMRVMNMMSILEYCMVKLGINGEIGERGLVRLGEQR